MAFEDAPCTAVPRRRPRAGTPPFSFSGRRQKIVHVHVPVPQGVGIPTAVLSTEVYSPFIFLLQYISSITFQVLPHVPHAASCASRGTLSLPPYFYCFRSRSRFFASYTLSIYFFWLFASRGAHVRTPRREKCEMGRIWADFDDFWRDFLSKMHDKLARVLDTQETTAHHTHTAHRPKQIEITNVTDRVTTQRRRTRRQARKRMPEGKRPSGHGDMKTRAQGTRAGQPRTHGQQSHRL